MCRISLDIAKERAFALLNTIHPRPLAVTESLVLPPQQRAVSMSTIHKFDLRDWPILVPVFLGLPLAGAVTVRW